MSNFPVHLIEGDIGTYISRLLKESDDAEKRGYLKGLSDALTAIHEPNILWAHARAIEALKAKVHE
jgi:hypothetical protein